MLLLMLALAFAPFCRGLLISINSTDIWEQGTKVTGITCKIEGYESDSWGYVRLMKLQENGFRPAADVVEIGQENRDADAICAEKSALTDVAVNWTVPDRDLIGLYYCDATIFKDTLAITWLRSVVLQIVKHGDNVDILVQNKCCGIPKNTSWLHLYSWPAGTFGLLQPESGCPVEESKWDTGSVKMVTESSRPLGITENQASPNIKLRQPLFETVGEKKVHFVNFSFCLKVEDGPMRLPWPSGSYCLLKKNNKCPDGFANGTLILDLEDTTPLPNKYNKPLPSGRYYYNAEFDFCCRKDGPAKTPVVLPTARPFFLFRFGGVCQEVLCMNVTEQYIVIDTEDVSARGPNVDQFKGVHPDGDINNVLLQLCYYEPK